MYSILCKEIIIKYPFVLLAIPLKYIKHEIIDEKIDSNKTTENSPYTIM